MAQAAQADAARYSSEAGLEAWMALLSNSDQTAQIPRIARVLGYKYCAVCHRCTARRPMVGAVVGSLHPPESQFL